MKVTIAVFATLVLSLGARAAGDADVVLLRGLARAIAGVTATPKGKAAIGHCIEGWNVARVEGGRLVLGCNETRPPTLFEAEKLPGFTITGKKLVDDASRREVTGDELEKARALGSSAFYWQGKKAEQSMTGAARAEEIGALTRALTRELASAAGIEQTEHCGGSVEASFGVEKDGLVYRCHGADEPGVVRVPTPGGFWISGGRLIDTVDKPTFVSEETLAESRRAAEDAAGRLALAKQKKKQR